MFDQPNEYSFVQRERGIPNIDPYVCQYVYKFFVRSETSRFKYIVVIKDHENDLYSIDYYFKTKSPRKYRIASNQYKAHKVIGTALRIMTDFRLQRGESAIFGMIAAEGIEELEPFDQEKRFRVYKNLFARTINPNLNKVMIVPEIRAIFIYPKQRENEREEIIKRYESVFATLYG